MSTIIKGEIYADEDIILSLFDRNEKFGFNIVKICAENDFGIHFLDRPKEQEENLKNKIVFSLSDNFMIINCERFMESVYYPINLPPTFEKLYSDINKLKVLMETILSYDFIDRIELFITVGEVDDCEYKHIEASLDTFEQIVFDEYKSYGDVPTIDVILTR